MYQATVNQKKAESDLAYDLQKFKTGQLVMAEQVQVQINEKQKNIELQQQEILRKQRELEATVQGPPTPSDTGWRRSQMRGNFNWTPKPPVPRPRRRQRVLPAPMS